jgi:2-keto-4-pentenoate hydratase
MVTEAMLSNSDYQRWADRLESARLAQTPIPPLTDELGDLSTGDAYAIARCAIKRRLDAGAKPVGHKIGLTSTAVQEQLGVDSPDYGTLLDDMSLHGGAVIGARRLIAPKVELELAFHLGQPLAGPGVTVDDVNTATDYVMPAVEIADSRIAGWRIRLADTIADNASAGAFVLGATQRRLDEVDVAGVEVALRRDGDVVERGRSDAVLGDPRLAVAWLANALAAFGDSLHAGDVVLSGACTRMVDARPGDAFVGDFGRLGTVRVSFEALP